MKKSVRSLPVAEAVKQARADLHLEYAAVPEWGRHIFTQLETGQHSLAEAHREIDLLVHRRIAAKSSPARAAKGMNTMDQLMIADVRQKLSAIFDQVSEPLYHKGEGPFFMATQEQGGEIKFFLYEANTVEAFLADPEKLPVAFAEADFLFSATDGLDMTNVEQSQRDYVLYMIRLVPDSPACRLAIRKLSEQNPEQVLNIALLNEQGNIVPAASLVDAPVLLS